jgi:signal transduction histidine kinase
VVRADEKRLRQILINLLGNAVKFTERGEVSLGLRYQREMATFTIRDTGPALPRPTSHGCSSLSSAASSRSRAAAGWA